MSELTKRILSSLIAVPVSLYLTWWGGWTFVITLIVISIVLQIEIIRMMENKNYVVRKGMSLLLGIPVLLFPLFPETSWMAFLLLFLILLLVETFLNNNEGWKRLMSTIMVAFLTPALLSGLLFLRNFGDGNAGFILIFTLLIMVWTNDIFAYLGGKTLGKHLLAPKLSPGKTVEGFICGFAGGLLALYFCHLMISDFPLSGYISSPFAVLVGLFGPAGDLAESKLKRFSGIKDSSRLMPGHGGLYDRLDSILFAAPVSAIYFYVLDYLSIL